MGRRKPWEEFPVINGFWEIKNLSWRYFFNFVYEEMLNFQTYIWRGHRCDEWILESTLDRLRKKAKIAAPNRYNFSEQHLEQFKHAVRGRRGANPPKLETENDWWALGQHYGLATPLLDLDNITICSSIFCIYRHG